MYLIYAIADSPRRTVVTAAAATADTESESEKEKATAAAASTEGLSEYEVTRLANIAANKRQMELLGLANSNGNGDGKDKKKKPTPKPKLKKVYARTSCIHLVFC